MTVLISVLDALSDVVGVAVVIGAAGFCALLLPSAWGVDR